MKKICSMMIPLSLGIYLSNTTSLNAAIQWLPDALEEGLKFSGFKSSGESTSGGHGKGDGCDSKFNLSECPTNGDCDRCDFANKYYFKGCKNGYKPNSKGTACTQDCSTFTLSNCPGNANSCSGCDGKFKIDSCIDGYTKSDNQCVKVQEEQKCEAIYNLETCPMFAESCSNCGGKFKIESCVYGYTLSNNQCMPKIEEPQEPEPSQYCSALYFQNQCPEHGVCSECGGKFKLDSCNSGYHMESFKCYACAMTYSLDQCPEHATCRECGGKLAVQKCDQEYLKDHNRCYCKQEYSLETCPEQAICSSCEGKFAVDSCNSGYRPFSHRMCVEPIPVLYSDKTISTEVIPGKTPIGLVFDRNRSLAVALHCETSLNWSDEHFDISDLPNLSKEEALKDFNGKSNTAKILAYCKANGKSCPAVEYVSNYKTEGTNAGDWYLPSVGELLLLFNKHYSIAEFKDFSQIEVSGLLSVGDYWTSNEPRFFADNHAYIVTTGTSENIVMEIPKTIGPVTYLYSTCAIIKY